eukprot:PhM_4_TR16627/c0_g1_i1/m.31019/K07918/RAB32; Ras-related protein Rab-32
MSSATSDATGGAPIQERLLKLLVVGDYAVGKTSLVRRYCENEFTENYRITIGVDYHEKVLPSAAKGRTRVQLWDVAGHERFGAMTRTYYKYAVGGVVVFDVTREASLESCSRWLADIQGKVQLPNGNNIPLVLVGTKVDLVEDEAALDALTAKYEQFASENGFLCYFGVSSKTGSNVERAMDFLLQRVESSMEGIPLVMPSQPEATSLRSLPYMNVGLRVQAKEKRAKCCK